MRTNASTPGIIVSKFSVASSLIKVLVLLLISIGMHHSVLLAQTRQQILEKRKAMSVEKSIRPHQSNVKPNSRLLRPNGTLCDFTLTPANASNNTLAQIIQSLVGNGITVSNIQTNLPPTSNIYGSFSCGTSVVGIESGLLLTSGSIENVNIPNNFSGFTTENHLPGDTLLLARLTDTTGYDASIVSFDIVSNTNKISFQYVFASDEYNEFVGSEFNDVFGFFISGPGIATNIGINGTQNIALVPNSPAPISINTVNNNLNSQYYINNEFEDESDTTRFYHLEYDGLTTVLTATATVQPGTKYTIILAIEDVADQLYDSGVFIKGGSFTSGSCTPSVSIAANPGNTICAATNVTFTATPTNGGATPSYQWKLNGANVGTNSNTYQNAALTNNAKITCVMTSSLACANPTTATSNEITMAVTSSVAPSVSIAANPTGVICSGTNVTFTATPTNGGATPSYQWKLNGTNVGTNSNTYQNAALANNAKITCVVTSSLACANPTTATSNEITVAVTAAGAPSVSIAANPAGAICTGTSVTFTATPTNGGATPSYQWKLNGNNVGTNSNIYQNAALVNGDKITCVMTSALLCANPKTDTSNQITISVTATVTPSVSIAAIPAGAICPGTNVTFTATPTNGGSTPAYQWKLNGTNVGTNSNTYQSAALANGNKITCVMTSSLTCANPKTATSNQITNSVTATVTPSVSIAAIPAGAICPGTNVTFTATPTNGGATPAYQWKRNGNNVGTISNTYQNAALVNGDKITCLMTSALLCANPKTDTSNQITMSVTATVAPSVSIAAIPAGAICPGTNVTFTATPTNGGATPAYQWKRNGNNVGTNSNTYQNPAFVNGDKITCLMTSALLCANPKTDTSNQITMSVTVLLATIIPTGSLSFCLGKSVLLRANTGAGYTYQWKKAGVNIAGATLANYTATVAGVYTVLVTNALGCSITSASITVLVNALPVATVAAVGSLTFCTGKTVLLKAYAGAGYTYQWKKAGVNIVGATLANYTATASGVYTVLVTNALGCSITSAAITVVVNALPVATVTAVGPLTFCTGKNVLLKAYPGAGYTYQWKKAGVNIVGATLANYTATASGVYTVLVTNALGCSITSAATTVVVNPLPIATVTAGGPLTFCAGKTVLLKAYPGAGYIYQWKKAGVNIVGATIANYTATVSGVYTVLVTNALGCSITSAAITVVVNPLPIATITDGGPLTFCAGKTVLLKAYAGAGYIYQWKKAGVNIAGATLANYTATVSGVYTVLVTNALGCSITSAATTVVVNPLPIATVTVGGPLTFCTGKNVLLKAYAGAGYIYQWKKAGVNIAGATLANYTATASGVYTVLVTNAQGCSITSAATTVVVNPLPIATVTAGGPLTFCADKNVLLKAYPGAGYIYQWKKAGVNIAGATLVNYTATVSGVYTVLVTNALGCSITSAATTVVVNPLPIATVTAVGPLTFCADKNVLLKAYAGAGYIYQWKKAGINIVGATLANYTATAAGVYTVLVTNALGCSITSAATTVVVNLLPIATVTASGPLTFCADKNVLLKAYAGAGYIYQWKKAGINIAGATLANYTATASGIYTVLVTNAVGCSITSAATTVVVNPLPIATITPGGPLTITVGGNVLLSATAGVGNTYQWKKDGINISGATAAAYTATTSGTYTVIITNSNLCQATSQPVQVSVSPAPAITKGGSSSDSYRIRQEEINQMNPEPVIKVFPNPLHGDEYLNFAWNISNADKSIQVTVFDISGRKIESRFLNSYEKKLKINGVSGIYMVEIRWGKNERKIFQIIKF